MMKSCLELAQKMLELHGAFAPFGMIIDASGERRPVVGDTGNPEAKAAELYQLIATSMRRQYFNQEIVAGAIVAEASIPPEFSPTFPDGVRITVESTSISRLVFLPFRRVKSAAAPEDKPTIEFGELLGVNVRPTIFAV